MAAPYKDAELEDCGPEGEESEYISFGCLNKRELVYQALRQDDDVLEVRFNEHEHGGPAQGGPLMALRVASQGIRHLVVAPTNKVVKAR
jgi:hypothetical protein